MTAFTLPHRLEAAEPPLQRDGVRLLVAAPDDVRHADFADFASFLEPGDLVVVNTSGTLAAAIDGNRGEQQVTVHFASALDDGSWVVEVRPSGRAQGPLDDLRAGEAIALPDGVRLQIDAAHPAHQHRLWRAEVGVEGSVVDYLTSRGRPIRYAYVPNPQPLAAYQTVFAREPGSAEMPSAGRPFTDRLVTELVTAGIGVAPILLHTGVSSPEAGEPPQAERFRVSDATAAAVNTTRDRGGRIVAVGTTVTRALESAVDGNGRVRASDGWTDVVLGEHRPAAVVSGLVTGWHAPGASHLDLLRAVAGVELVDKAYAEALRANYLWHEFGDSCLLLP